MMQKILIVDDEKLARSDILYKVSRSGFQFEWIMEASSAEESLEIIREDPPDILLTDIVMNGHSGIDLIREANKICPKMVSVIICGHADFSFAQEAISLNVVAYLLKPVREGELSAVLSKAIVEILRRKNMMHLAVRNDILERKLSDRTLQENLYSFLNGAKCEPDFSVAPLFPPDTGFFQVGILRVNLREARGELPDGFSESDDKLLRYGIQNIIGEIGGERFLTLDHFSTPGHLTVIGTAKAGEEETAGRELRSMFRRVHCMVSRNLGVSLCIGVSLPEKELAGIQVTQARQALDLRLCRETGPSGCVFFYGDYVQESVLPQEDLKLYLKFLEDGDLNNALKTVRAILDSPEKSHDLCIRMAYVEMICILARTCFRKGVSIFSLLGSECVSGTMVDRFESKQELIENLCGVVQTALKQWVGCSVGIDAVLRNVRSAIESDFSDSGLCTNALSSRFCISSGYLSAAYKKAFGVTISKYIISLRMKHAAELLQSTQLPVADIAENCGFNNLSYFMRMFKRYYGRTPTEYRKHRPPAPGRVGARLTAEK
jgi:two-component system response regulator YesN